MSSCGVGTSPLPGDPSNDILLSAVAAFGGVDLTWSFPSTNPHAVAYVKVYRGSSSVFGSSIKIAEAGGTYYFDKRPVAATYFYWIQVISISGTLVATVGPASALSKLAVDEVIAQLTGVIDTGLLATNLRAKVDQISVINGNLANEIFDRQTGETSLAQAMADVANGVAAANTFIIAERNERITQNSAIIEQVDGLVLASGGNLGAIVTSQGIRLTTAESTLGTTVTTMNAMYTTKLTVNGLVGGFGLANNGTQVEAAFDVDKFWIGRTGSDQQKPFIITGGVVYIKEAVIPTLTASKIDTRGLTIRDINGNIILSAGTSLNSQVSAAAIGAVQTSLANAPAGILNSNVTPAGIGAVNTNLSNAPAGILNSNLTASITAAQNAADAASLAASNAATAASTANAAVTEIASDLKLTPGEKQQVKRERDSIAAEKTLIDSQATARSVSTTAFGTAFTTFTNYVDPLVAVLTTTSDIVGTDFRAAFANYYAARQTILNSIAAAAAATAAYATVSGIPANLATAGASPGTSVLNNDAGLQGQITTAGTTANWTGVSGVPANVANATVNRVFRQTTAPTGTLYAGDTWYKTDYGSGSAIYTHNGSVWVLQSRAPISTSAAYTGSTWGIPGDTAAFNAIAARGYNITAGDTVNLYNLSTGYSETRMLNYDSAGWVPISLYINGSVVINGTLSANALIAGSIFAGMTFKVGTADVSGTTMTGSGGVINSTGTFSLGNVATNITFNGSTMTMNGAWVTASNLNLGGFTASITGGGTLTHSTASLGTFNIGSRGVSASGGTLPYTYTWTVTVTDRNGTGFIITPSSLAGTTLLMQSKLPASGDSAIAVAQCIVTDANGRTAIASFIASTTHTA